MQERQPVEAMIEKVAKECEEASATKWDVARIVKELSQEEVSEIESLRDMALRLLEQLNPEAARIYASFHRLRVHTSANYVEPFNRGNIIQSLLKETDVTRTVAEKIGNEVENKIKDLKISYLTTSLIREMVNVKLLEYGFERIRNQYARVGMPMFDVTEKIGESYYHDEDVLTEYNLLKVIPKEISSMHFAGEIFIADIAGFSTKPFAFSSNPNAEDVMFSAIEEIGKTGEWFSVPPAINAANVYLAGSAKKNSSKKEIVKNFARGVSAAGAQLAGRKICIGLNLFVPEELDKAGKDRDAVFSLANEFLNYYFANREQLNLEVKILLETEYQLKLLEDRFFRKNLEFLNCSGQALLPLSGGFFSRRRGILSLTGLNLVKIALESNDENRFIMRLGEVLGKINELNAIKAEQVGRRGWLKKSGISADDLEPVLGLGGLYAAGAVLLGDDSTDRLRGFGERIVKEISGRIGENWMLTEFYDRMGLERFRKINLKEFGFRARGESSELYLESNGFTRTNYRKTCVAKNRKDVEELLKQGVAQVRLN